MEDKALDGTEIYVSVTEGITEDHIKLAMDRLPGWRREYVEKRALSARIEGTFSYLLLQKSHKDRFLSFVNIRHQPIWTYSNKGRIL